MTRGVEEGEGDSGAFEGGGAHEDGDAAFFFDLIGVEEGVAVVDATGGADDAGGFEDGFGEGGLAGVDVSDDADDSAFHWNFGPFGK